jgi:hypothetical protein
MAALACVATLVVVANASAATRSVAPRVAENRLLQATHMLARWRIGLVDVRRNVVRRNTTATCRGLGRVRAGGYSRLTCVVAYRKVRVQLLFVPLHGTGFEVRQRHVRNA